MPAGFLGKKFILSSTGQRNKSILISIYTNPAGLKSPAGFAGNDIRK